MQQTADLRARQINFPLANGRQHRLRRRVEDRRVIAIWDVDNNLVGMNDRIGLVPELLRHIVAGEKAQLAPLLRAAAERSLVGAELHTGMWHDVGTPERLRALDAQFSTAQI